MPVTSSRSSVKRWPSPEQVLAAAEAWARRLSAATPTVIAVGCIGSYARGDAGIGSDLDLVVVRADDAPIPDLLGADVDALPVPTDVLHYTTSELERVLAQDGRMAHVLRYEARFFVGDLADGVNLAGANDTGGNDTGGNDTGGNDTGGKAALGP